MSFKLARFCITFEFRNNCKYKLENQVIGLNKEFKLVKFFKGNVSVDL